jgi:hypothetical protein
MTRLACLLALVACADTVTVVDPAPVYADIADELQSRVNDLNRTLVRCWEVPNCRRTTLITWTSWDSTHAPAFILRPKP